MLDSSSRRAGVCAVVLTCGWLATDSTIAYQNEVQEKDARRSEGHRIMSNHAVRRKNRLAKATSPYLLQHAENPVDWYEWGDDAFTKARREDKPIFLSIGYAAWHQ